MKDYDARRPLVFIHVPKAAGTSVRHVFRGWFGPGLYDHYFDERRGLRPTLPDLHGRPPGVPVVVYGHFNRLRGFGVEHDLPWADQFVTILRDPYDAAVSAYHYVRRHGHDWQDQSRVPKADLRQYLLQTPPNLLNHFPRVVTHDNYREQIETWFVEIGVMSALDESLQRIARRLGLPYQPGTLPHDNATPRTPQPPAEPDLRDWYRERHALEHAVYDHVAARYAVPARSPALPAPTPALPRHV